MHRILLTVILLAAAIITGCSSKSKLARHIERADNFYEEGKQEEARIEYMNAFQLDESNPHVVARLAEAFLKNGDVENAFRFFSQTIALQPTNNDARVKLATILLLGGRSEKGREQAVEVLKNEPLHTDALLIFANASVHSNEVAEARSRLESLAAAHPDNAAVQLGLGTLAQRAGMAAAAETSFKQAVALEPKSAKAHLALGSFYFQRGDTTNAGVHLKAAMELSPLQSVERLGFAEYLAKTGQGDAAVATLNEATSKHPDFTAAWNMLTKLAFAQNNTNQAAEYISKVLAQSPDDRDAILNRSRLKLASRDIQSALADLEQLSNANPRDSDALFQLAVAQFASDNPSQAFISVNKAISANTNHVEAYLLRARLQVLRSDWNNAIPELTQLIRRFPQVAQAYYLLGAAQRSRGNLDAAVAVYTAITKNFPKDPQGFQLLGTTLRQQNKLGPARQAFEGALKVNPDFLAAIDSLTDLDIGAKQFDAAIERVNFYVEKYPKSPLPPLLLGKILFQQQKNTEAEAAVQKAIALEPEYMPAHRALAEFYSRTQQTDKAIGKLEAIVAKDERDLASLIQLGMLYESKGDFARATPTYQKVLKLNPNSIIALNNLAYILSERLGKVDEGLQFARTARNLSPQDPHSADTFGWILFKKGQYVEAMAPLQQAAAHFGDQPEVQYHLGMTQYMMGDIASATAALTKATQSTNQFIGKDRAKDALTILQIDPARTSPATVATVERHIANHPKDVFAHVQLARLYEGQREWNKAREAYEKLLPTNPDSMLLLSGLGALYAGPLQKPERAMELARKAWTASPTPDTAAVLGPVAYAAGDFRWANGRLIEANRFQSSANVLYFKGLTSYALGYVPQAREELNRAAQSTDLSKEKTALAKAGAELAGFHLGEVALEAAQAAITAARRIEPAFLPATVAAALVAERKNDFTTARAAYEAALHQHPSLLVAQRQLALLLGEKLPDDRRAEQLATALRQDFPNDPALLKVLGKIAYRRGEYREAAGLLTTAASRQANDGDLLYHLGMAQYHLKDRSAKASLTKAISLEPNATLAADARKALAELN